MSAQEVRLKPDFRERAKANDVAVGRLIGLKQKTSLTDGPRSCWQLDHTTRTPYGDIARRDSLRHC